MATCSAMVAITGCGRRGLELVRVGALQPGQVAGDLDHHALQTQAEAEDRDLVLAGVADGADLALHAADAEAAGEQTPSTSPSSRAAPSGVSQLSDATQRMSPWPGGRTPRPVAPR